MVASELGIRFGTAAVPGPQNCLKEIALWSATLEKWGFDLLGVADSPSIYPELFSALAVVAEATSSVRVATWVTNPVLRHPVVAASGLRSAQAFGGDRITAGVGIGDSALANAGRRPATLSETAGFIEAVRALVQDGAATWNGQHVHMAAGRSVPIFLAASGPRGLSLAGAIADGAIVASRIDHGGVQQALSYIHKGAEAAERDAEEVEVWWNIKISVGNSRAEAISDIAYALAARAHYAFSRSLDGVPRRLHAAIGELLACYRPQEHGRLGTATNGSLVFKLGLADFLADRYAVAGTPDECLERLADLASQGMRNVFTMLNVRDRLIQDPVVTEIISRVAMPRSNGT
jgi:5,10-methylenetetrahydromethanopterin reductase